MQPPGPRCGHLPTKPTTVGRKELSTHFHDKASFLQTTLLCDELASLGVDGTGPKRDTRPEGPKACDAAGRPSLALPPQGRSDLCLAPPQGGGDSAGGRAGGPRPPRPHGVGSRHPPCPLASPLPRRLAHPRLQGARGQLHGHREPTSSSPWHVGLTKRETVSCLGLQIATCHRGLPMRSLAHYFQNTENKRF